MIDEEDVATASSEQKQEIAQAFTQNITQNISIHQPRNVAIGEGNSIEDLSQNIRISVQEGNTESLVTYLKELGLNDQDIDEIAPLFSYIYDGVPEGGDRATVSEWVLAKAEKLSGDVVSSAIATTIINGFIAYAPSAADFFSTIPLG